jgi:multiple sugar transport system substrate-binding protein
MGQVSMVLWPGPEGEAMQKVVDAYNGGPGKRDGVNVKMILLSRTDTFAKEATMMSSRSDEVDVYFTASYILGQHAPYLDPLGEVLGGGASGNYFPFVLDSVKLEGKAMALPLDVSNHFLYYRTDLIDGLLNDAASGEQYRRISGRIIGESLEPKPPEDWVWEDFLAAAAFFTKRYRSDSPTEYGTALQLKNLIFNVMIWDDVLWSYGGGWLDGKGKPALTSEAAEKAMDVYTTAYSKGLTSPNSTAWEFPETQGALQTGSSAFAVQWSAGYDELNDPERSPKIAGKIGVAPVPGKEHKTHVHSLAIGLNKYAKNKEAALKWMKYLATPEAMETYARNGGIPGMPRVLDSLGKRRKILPIISEHIRRYGYSPPILPETQRILEALATELSGAWAGQKDSDEALGAAQQSMESILSQ